MLRAVFKDSFSSGAAGSTSIAAGNHLPGTPERYAFAELAWNPARAWAGFNAGIELAYTGRLWGDDANSDAAPGAGVLALRSGFAQQLGAWRFAQRVRLDNALDRKYAGSVIVNESNKRYFEPGLPRNWLLALTLSREID